MKPLYTSEQFILAKSNDLLECQCYQCSSSFKIKKRRIVDALNPKQSFENKFCSKKCFSESKLKQITVNCTNCGLEYSKKPSQIRSVNNFCSNSCNATYSNKHKVKGTRRSKLEIWLEEELTQLYPDLSIDFNKTSAIGSELDIYIPNLNLAFELNGIFHYEPIYGSNKLTQIQSNDKSKSLACHEAKIDLCVIDTSGQNYFKPSTSQKYLDIIINIINERIII